MSEAKDFVLPETMEVAIGPKKKDGTQPTMTIKKLDEGVVIPILECIPGWGDPSVVSTSIAENMERANSIGAKVCPLAIVSPEFDFDGSKPDLPKWSNVPYLIRQEAVNAILGLAGFGAVPEPAGTFSEGAS